MENVNPELAPSNRLITRCSSMWDVIIEAGALTDISHDTYLLKCHCHRDRILSKGPRTH